MEIREKIENLMQDTELMQKLENVKSAEEIIALLGEQGLEVSEENAQAALAALNSNGELSEEDLEKVAGGVGPWGLIAAGAVVLVVALYGTIYALSKFVNSWNKKKKK